MNEKLKTLKDIEKSEKCLKAEAIKWVKDIYNFEKPQKDFMWEKITGKQIIYSLDAMISMSNWIKHFFNLTDEDLKDKKEAKTLKGG